MESNYNNILVHVDGSIARIKFNRPEVYNALSYEMMDEISEAIRKAGEEPEIRVIVLSGNGKSFCAGDDLRSMGKEMAQEGIVPGDENISREKVYNWMYEKGYENIVMAVRETLKPVIASVKGHTLGAGFDIALSCDFRVITEDANLGLVYAQHAIASGIMSLPKMVGNHKATEILFTGKTFSGKEAYYMGMVNVLTTEEKLEEDTVRLAEEFVNMPTASIGIIKDALNSQLEIEETFKKQAEMLTRNFFTRDFVEGINAFSNKRLPEFIGQ